MEAGFDFRKMDQSTEKEAKRERETASQGKVKGEERNNMEQKNFGAKFKYCFKKFEFRAKFFFVRFALFLRTTFVLGVWVCYLAVFSQI